MELVGNLLGLPEQQLEYRQVAVPGNGGFARPVDVAVMAVDQEKIDAARSEAVAEMQAKVDKAKAARDKAEEKRKEAMHSAKLPPWTTAWANSPFCRQKDSSASATAVFITASYLFP